MQELYFRHNAWPSIRQLSGGSLVQAWTAHLHPARGAEQNGWQSLHLFPVRGGAIRGCGADSNVLFHPFTAIPTHHPSSAIDGEGYAQDPLLLKARR